jgi:hypothetical protein
MEWKPSRWILGGSSAPLYGSQGHSNDTSEQLFVPVRGSYIAWSDGLRPCPGKKFSQVEFVATMVGLFRRHRVEVVPNKEETLFDARERVKKVVNDNVIVLLLQMKEPKTVGLKWLPR